MAEDVMDKQDELEERIRMIEINHSSLTATIVNMNDNVSEMKQMFQKFLLDSNEISRRVEAIAQLERTSKELSTKYDEFFNRFVILEYTCKTCTITKVNEYIKDVSDKVSKIESCITEMKGNKTRLNGFWGNVVQTIITVAILYLFYIVAIHMQPTDNPMINAPTLKEKTKNSLSIIPEADAYAFVNYTNYGKKGKTYVE